MDNGKPGKTLSNINEPLLKLTDKEILDFIKCPQYFCFRYLSKIPISDKKSFRELVGEVIDSYYVQLLGGRLPTVERAKRIWDDICESNSNTITDKKVLEGWGLIKLFDRYVNQEKLIIADTHTSYKVSFGNTVQVSGKMDPLRVKGKRIELFAVDTSTKLPDQQLLDMSLRFSLEAYALTRSVATRWRMSVTLVVGKPPNVTYK